MWNPCYRRDDPCGRPHKDAKTKREKNIMKDRKSTRLKKYDYSKIGYYFVTICTYNNDNLFGNIIDSAMIFNDLGEIAFKE